nr:glycoside hydrolase family 2 TIM barrel-domain containing protein [uncultured Schaedlerella sp.]
MQRQNFNRDWTVRKVPEGMAYSAPGSEGQKVTLPHDAMIWEKRSTANTSGSAGGYYAGGNYEYVKNFYVDEAEKAETFILEFEGIHNSGYVYVNGALAGSVQGGYTRLLVDITPYLCFGADNQVLVKAINTAMPNSRWYTGSGIYRPVHLHKGGKIRIDVDGLRISTPEISEGIAAVRVDTSVIYDGKVRKTVALKTEILAPNGEIVAGESSRMTLHSQSKTVQTQRIYVKEPALWSVDDPQLYCCKVTIYDGETVLDTAESTFGIRRLELDPVNGLRINGEKILLRGGCIHHDNGPVGAATFERAEERRIELLKEAGFNSIRAAHNSSSKALLDACDRLGMLVMEESFDMWTQTKRPFDYSLVFADNWEKDLEDIVRKDFNHPCVFMYSVGNEIKEIHTPNGAQWSRKMTDKIRSLDSTRYVTNAINGMIGIMDDLPAVMKDMGMTLPERTPGGGINDTMTALMGAMNYLSSHPKVEDGLKEAYGTLDLIGLNYMRDVYDQMKEYPNRVFYGAETLPPDIAPNWKKVKELPSCIGDYTWTAWDYLGEAGIGIVTYDGRLRFAKSYPAYLAYCGDLDITGYRRPMSYLREIVFGLRKAPYIAVQLPEHYGKEPMCTPWSLPITVSSWTWKGQEEKKCLVEVYSDAPEVELFVNGNSVGRKPAGEEHNYRVLFDTVYVPGEIRAEAYYEDGTIESHCLRTAKDEVSLCMKPDRVKIGKDDLAYVMVELRDADGTLQTAADRKVCLKVEGAGHVQGFGSADPVSEENFFDESRKTYYGRALAVIRSGEDSGTIRLTVWADGLEAAFLEIEVE